MTRRQGDTNIFFNEKQLKNEKMSGTYMLKCKVAFFTVNLPY